MKRRPSVRSYLQVGGFDTINAMCSRHDQPWLEPPEAHGTVCRKRALARGAALLACLLAVTARFRPILMTALATVVGILPIALGRGAGGDSRAPLGIAVAGGR